MRQHLVNRCEPHPYVSPLRIHEGTQQHILAEGENFRHPQDLEPAADAIPGLRERWPKVLSLRLDPVRQRPRRRGILASSDFVLSVERFKA